MEYELKNHRKKRGLLHYTHGGWPQRHLPSSVDGRRKSRKKFKKIFAFCVLSVSLDKYIPKENEYLSFEDHKGMFKVIFTAVDKLLSGEWPILNAGNLKDPNMITFEFNMAGTLYRSGEPVRVLPIEEYRNHIAMAVSGYALVNDFINQY
ncbi:MULTISPECIES: hypothetical protein [Pseudomonas syringae group]|uniref:hypothetical protein n=1 Tax=Pseudomonas syringae group TaxID=136849 RepID=UPI000F4CF7F8|nr:MULTISPECIES: hypothetical protein [Pseudomonas syringae group]